MPGAMGSNSPNRDEPNRVRRGSDAFGQLNPVARAKIKSHLLIEVAFLIDEIAV